MVLTRFSRVLTCAALTLAIVSFILTPSLAEAFKRTGVGDTARDFTLPTLQGEKLTLTKSLGPKATIIAFWAAWSPRSQPMLKDLQSIFAEHEKDGLKVMGVNVEHPVWDKAEEPKIIQAIADSAAAYPMVIDKDFAIYNDYGVVVVPSIVLLDKEGKVVALTTGYSSTGKDMLKEDVQRTLGLVKAEEAVAKKDEGGYKPNNVAVRHLMMAEKFLGKKMYTKAEAAAKDAIAKDGEYVQAYRVLAEALKKQGREEESAASVLKADEFDAKHKLPPAGDKEQEKKEAKPEAKPEEGKGPHTSMSPRTITVIPG
ncbi:TlpA family protein disulfide reductase [bacterium]|nr:MAG: TlpA family protein disulfide reductase [bacterium]